MPRRAEDSGSHRPNQRTDEKQPRCAWDIGELRLLQAQDLSSHAQITRMCPCAGGCVCVHVCTCPHIRVHVCVCTCVYACAHSPIPRGWLPQVAEGTQPPPVHRPGLSPCTDTAHWSCCSQDRSPCRRHSGKGRTRGSPTSLWGTGGRSWWENSTAQGRCAEPFLEPEEDWRRLGVSARLLLGQPSPCRGLRLPPAGPQPLSPMTL